MTIEDLAAELATPDGFASRVEAAPGLLRQVGGGFGIVGVILLLGSWANGTPRTGWLLLGGGAVVAVVLTLAGILTERRTLRPLHRAYLERGWLAAQVPTGVVLDNSGDGGNEIAADDWTSVRGRRERRTPIALVGGPGVPAEALAAAAAAHRRELEALPWREAFDARQRVHAQMLSRGSGDATPLFAVPPGTLLAPATGRGDLVVVIPAGDRSRRRRTRFYAVRPLRGRSPQRA